MDEQDFEVVASSLRADAADLHTFIEVLASKLEGALPGRVSVERRGGGLFGGKKTVRGLGVELGPNQYELFADKGKIAARRAQKVRGIIIKTEEMPLDQWIDELSRELTEEAQQSEGARLALQRLLGA